MRGKLNANKIQTKTNETKLLILLQIQAKSSTDIHWTASGRPVSPAQHILLHQASRHHPKRFSMNFWIKSSTRIPLGVARVGPGRRWRGGRSLEWARGWAPAWVLAWALAWAAPWAAEWAAPWAQSGQVSAPDRLHDVSHDVCGYATSRAIMAGIGGGSLSCRRWHIAAAIAGGWEIHPALIYKDAMHSAATRGLQVFKLLHLPLPLYRTLRR